jgi:hypothetical protein
MDHQLKLFDMQIKQPEYIVKFGKTSYMNVEYRFSDHELLKDYDLEVTFSHKMTEEQADSVESEYLQKYPKILYDFEFNYDHRIDGEDEMRFIDKGVINKIIQELYERKKNQWSQKLDETVVPHKFYFVTFYLKGSKAHRDWKKRVVINEQKKLEEKNKEAQSFKKPLKINKKS